MKRIINCFFLISGSLVIFPGKSLAHDIYLSTTDGAGPDSAVITITSFLGKDTIREVIYWKDIEGNMASTKNRHYYYFRVDITCTGYNDIGFYKYGSERESLRFVLGKPGTKYLAYATGILPYISHPNEVYVLYDPRKIKDLYRIFDRLKIPYTKRKEVRQVFLGLNYKTQDLWLLKHSIPFKASGSKALEGLRKADSVIYSAGPLIEVYDNTSKQFKKVMLSNNFGADQHNAAAIKQYEKWERQGFTKEKSPSYGPQRWNAPLSMGTGLIDLLLQLNKEVFLDSWISYSDLWNYSQTIPEH